MPFSGAVTRSLALLSRAKSGVLALAGTVVRGLSTLARTKTGVLTLTGAFTRLINAARAKAGSLTFSGASLGLKGLSRAKSGVLDLTGAISSAVSAPLARSVSGILAVAGTLSHSKLLTRAKSGVLALSGAVTGGIDVGARSVSGTLTFVGSLISESGALRALTGPLTFVSTLAYAITHPNSKYGVLNLSGTLTKGFTSWVRTKAGTLDLSGAYSYVVQQVAVPYLASASGIQALTGTLSKIFTGLRSFTGPLIFSGSLTRTSALISRTVTGILALTGTFTAAAKLQMFTGDYSRILNLLRTLSGPLALSGTISRAGALLLNRTKTGVLVFTGAIESAVNHGVTFVTNTGVLDLAGTLARILGMGRAATGAATFVGTLTRQLFSLTGAEAGELTFSGSVDGDAIAETMYYGVINP